MFPAEFTPHTVVREPEAIAFSPPLICFQWPDSWSPV
jgi:hypothetical protein